jgi:hypothetical protein
MSQMSFSTSELNELDLQLINVLLTQANQGEDKQNAVLTACEFVVKKLSKGEQRDSKERA